MFSFRSIVLILLSILTLFEVTLVLSLPVYTRSTQTGVESNPLSGQVCPHSLNVYIST